MGVMEVMGWTSREAGGDGAGAGAAVGHQIAGPVTGLVPHMRLLSQVGRGDGQRLRYLLRTRQSFAELHQHTRNEELFVRAVTGGRRWLCREDWYSRHHDERGPSKDG